MEVVFKNQYLKLIETDRAADTKLPVAVIQSCRKKLNFLRSIPDERTLRGWKSLHYEKLKGDREGQRSIRLNNQWRLVFELDNRRSPPKVTVLELEDYH